MIIYALHVTSRRSLRASCERQLARNPLVARVIPLVFLAATPERERSLRSRMGILDGRRADFFILFFFFSSTSPLPNGSFLY